MESTKPISDIKGKDRDALVSIVKEMTESMTGAQSTRHWAEDALWFDIPPFASRGVQPALKFFDRVFGSFQPCKVDILEMDVVVNGGAAPDGRRPSGSRRWRTRRR